MWRWIIVVKYLEVSNKQGTDEFIIEPFKFISYVVVASLSNDIFHASHQMINELSYKIKCQLVNPGDNERGHLNTFKPTRSWIRSFIVGFRFSARLTFNILTSGLMVMPWRKTVKYTTAIVVVINIGCNGIWFLSIKSTNAKAMAPLRPTVKMMTIKEKEGKNKNGKLAYFFYHQKNRKCNTYLRKTLQIDPLYSVCVFWTGLLDSQGLRHLWRGRKEIQIWK